MNIRCMFGFHDLKVRIHIRHGYTGFRRPTKIPTEPEVEVRTICKRCRLRQTPDVSLSQSIEVKDRGTLQDQEDATE